VASHVETFLVESARNKLQDSEPAVLEEVG
jgi:hypothetical protein